jgi:GNAT superfamily N-acetyltransferase
VPALFGLIRELADYERLLDAFVGDERQLEAGLFDSGAADALIAEVDSDPVGHAIFFTTFSSFLCQPGLWIEDIYVRPQHRRSGIGRAMLARIARMAVQGGCGRLEWAVLDWNEPARRFYATLGAELMDQWQILRMEGDSLNRLAQMPSTDSFR